MHDTTLNLVSVLRDGDRIDYLGAEGDAILEAAKRVVAARYAPGTELTRPADASALAQSMIGSSPREEFLVLFLTTRHRVIASEIVAIGTIDSAAVYPREVVRRCIELKASNADRHLTQHLKNALRLIDVRVLDHLIVGPAGAPAYSMADAGEL